MIIELLTAILVISTIAYSFLTYRISRSNKETVDIMKEQTEAMSRPYIVIEPFVRPNTPLLYLKIVNTGKTSANNLRLSISNDFYQFGEENKNIKDFPAFCSTIDSFAPNQQLIFALAQGFLIFGESNSKLPKQFSITANYSFGTREVIETNHIDLRAYELSKGFKDPVVEELGKIREQLKKLKV
ncbi:MAG TPA: hypothetical protein VLN09_08535 [Psychrobacter sp.]|uniref:hypothetical protein n=1 Tax=Psychrobacter sp. TaxID=56811 RepID=UPI002B9FEA89|nr:hypothetical protein [Psychrobacter sp.]HSP85766.1 hypothetical protein [Psychrobacter sp.]